MLLRRGIVPVAALMVLFPLVSAAQTKTGLQQDKWKFIHFGSSLSDKQSNTTGIISSPETRKFPNLERVIRQDASITHSPDDSAWNDSINVINYYFGKGAWFPLVGLSMGYLQDDEEKNQFVAAPEIGLKYFMNSETFLYGLVEYQFPFNNIADMNDAYDNGRIKFGLGFGLTFSY